MLDQILRIDEDQAKALWELLHTFSKETVIDKQHLWVEVHKIVREDVVVTHENRVMAIVIAGHYEMLGEGSENVSQNNASGGSVARNTCICYGTNQRNVLCDGNVSK